MTFNLDTFKSRMARSGLSMNNLFIAKISPPISLLDANEEIAIQKLADMPFFCKSVEIPGIDFQTADISDHGFGIVEKRAIGMQYPTLPTVFMVDGAFQIKKFFHEWAKLVYNFDTFYGEGRTTNGTQRPYELNFKDEYVGTLEIDVFSENSDKHRYTYRFGNAYPINIGNVSVSWENAAEVLTLPVGFAFDTFNMVENGNGEHNPMLNRDNGMLTYTSALTAYGVGTNRIGQPRNIQELIDNLSRAYVFE